MSGPHIEDELYGMSDEEVARLVGNLKPAELDPPRRGFPQDDDEGPGADDGED